MRLPSRLSRWQGRGAPAASVSVKPVKRSSRNRVVVAVTEGRLDFGPWEQIFYGEYDGLRNKRVLVKIIGE